MPKVITREKDLTSAGSNQYSNFTVLVPGFVKPGFENKFAAVCDENDVYEVKNFKDFKENVGLYALLKSEAFIEPAYAEAEFINAQNQLDIKLADNDYIFEQISLDTILADKEKNLAYCMYIATKVEEQPVDHVNVLKINENGTDVYYTVEENPLDLAEIEISYDDEQHEAYIKLPELDDEEEPAEPIIRGFVFIKEENKGTNGSGEKQVYHYGNKMAAELLNLGYTVLFKKLDSIDQLVDPAAKFWEPLKDKIYDFRYVVTGLIENNLLASKLILDLCKFNLKDDEDDLSLTGRGDCFALIDIDERLYAADSAVNQFAAVKAIKESQFYTEFANVDGKYAMLCTPSVVYRNLPNEYEYTEDDVYDKRMPASFHYLACAAKALNSYNEWYAIAGYKRGLSDLNVVSAAVNFGDYAINALQPRKREEACSAINLICKIRNNYYLWGNRTAFYDQAEDKSPLGLVASDFLNIRQLCTTIKKIVYYACKRFTFDPNSDILWVKFISVVRPTLEIMKADQGIEDYKFVKIATDQKGELKARIRIIPIEAVEDFDICLTLEDSISGTVVSFDD